MTIDTLIMLGGGFVALLPFLGLPNSWDSVLYVMAGIYVIALGIYVRRKGKNLFRDERSSAPFTQRPAERTEGTHEQTQ